MMEPRLNSSHESKKTGQTTVGRIQHLQLRVLVGRNYKRATAEGWSTTGFGGACSPEIFFTLV